MNLDKTFCVSQKCEKRNGCMRNYYNLINQGIVFDRAVIMADFYKANSECEFYEGVKH